MNTDDPVWMTKAQLKTRTGESPVVGETAAEVQEVFKQANSRRISSGLQRRSQLPRMLIEKQDQKTDMSLCADPHEPCDTQCAHPHDSPRAHPHDSPWDISCAPPRDRSCVQQ